MPNAVDLCLTSTVAGDLGVADDAKVARAVTFASRAIARFCGRPFERATLTEYPAGYGRPLLLLARAPIVSIASITEEGATVDPSLYESVGPLADAGAVMRRNGGVWLNTGVLAGRITYSPDINVGRTDGIVVVYTAGFITPGQAALTPGLVVTVPEDLQEAAILTAEDLYRRRVQDLNLSSEALGDWSVSNREPINQVVQPDVAAMLAPYRSLRVS